MRREERRRGMWYEEDSEEKVKRNRRRVEKVLRNEREREVIHMAGLVRRGEVGDIVREYVGGRAARAELLRGIREALTPEEVQQWIKTALKLALEKKTPHTIVEILRFVVEYTIGKPIQAVDMIVGQEGRSGTPADWVRVFRDTEEEIGEIVDIVRSERRTRGEGER